MARKRTIPSRQIVVALAIGVVASLIGALIYSGVFAPRVYRVQIIPVEEGQPLKISTETLRETRNPDGILFVQATMTTKKDNGSIVVEVQPKDENVWYEQQVQQVGKRTYIARIQLGSKEWPIRGGEGYLLRASAGDDQAMARITVEKTPSGAE